MSRSCFESWIAGGGQRTADSRNGFRVRKVPAFDQRESRVEARMTAFHTLIDL